MHTGIENEILATLKIIAAQNNELITLVRGVIDDQVKEKENDSTIMSEILVGLKESGLANLMSKKLKDFKNEVSESDTCEDVSKKC